MEASDERAFNDKRQKIVHAEDIMLSVNEMRANEIIHLNFVEAKDNISTHPTFTHQIFSGEVINFLKSSTAQVHFIIDGAYLTTTLTFSEFSEEEKQVFISKLPQQLTDSMNTQSNEKLQNPPGSVIGMIQLGGSYFEIWRATDKDGGAAALLQRAENLAIWFIETADSVDFSDERWEALFLYRVVDSPEMEKIYYFAGYYTLFTFRNPFVGAKLRVCQALILPKYQGKGIGREMLLTVYRLAAERPDIVEITVEDPAPAFEHLRDAVDAEWYELCMLKSLPTKLTEKQNVFAKEANAYALLPRSTDDAAITNSESVEYIEFRKKVKLRILKDRKDVFTTALTKSQRNDLLQTFYEEWLDRFNRVLRSRNKRSLSR